MEQGFQATVIGHLAPDGSGGFIVDTSQGAVLPASVACPPSPPPLPPQSPAPPTPPPLPPTPPPPTPSDGRGGTLPYVCHTGFIVDTFCLNRGAFLDTGLPPLVSPNLHTFHCLVDVPFCFESGYEVLEAPTAPGLNYTRKFKLDAAGNAAALSLARATGRFSGSATVPSGCYRCTDNGLDGRDPRYQATPLDGTQEQGFRATVIGYLKPDGVLDISQGGVLPASVACPSSPPPDPPRSPAPPLPPPPVAGFAVATDSEFIGGFMTSPAGSPSGYTIQWRLEPTTAAAGAHTSVKVLITSTATGGWNGVGFGPGMTRADLVIGWPGGVNMYRPTATTEASVAGNLISNGVTGASAEVRDGTLRVAFTRSLASGGGTALTEDGTLNMIYAIGPAAQLGYHMANRGSFNIVLNGGAAAASNVCDTAVVNDDAKLRRLHAICMITSWGFLLPAGAIIAKTFKKMDPFWFHAHKCFQVLGLAIAFTGWMVALMNFAPLFGKSVEADPIGGTASNDKVSHYCMGMLVMAMGIAQPFNAMVRPSKGEHRRFVWEVLHKGFGWAAIVLASATIFLGIIIFDNQYGKNEVGGVVQGPCIFPEARQSFLTAYGLCIGVCGVIAIVGVVVNKGKADLSSSGKEVGKYMTEITTVGTSAVGPSKLLEHTAPL